MTHIRHFWVLSLLSLLFCTWSATAQTWENDRYHLSMQQPTDWLPMSKALLAQTNATISHVTGRGFIAGFALNEADTLVFPYMLVQFKPYTALPSHARPTAKLDERGKLELLYTLVGAFGRHGPLPQTIDTPQFIDRFGSDLAQLVRLEDDGRFDFTGKIPHQAGQDPIHYHTHGIIGKDGIALASVFTIEDFTGLTYVIQNDMRTLSFAQGFTADALPDQPPQPDPPSITNTDPTPPAIQASPAEPSAAPTPGDNEPSVAVTNTARGQTDATALIIILSLLGACLVAAALIIWILAHQKAQAQRERRRERLHRLHANQSAAQLQQPPQPTQPTTARAPGSGSRQRHRTPRP